LLIGARNQGLRGMRMRVAAFVFSAADAPEAREILNSKTAAKRAKNPSGWRASATAAFDSAARSASVRRASSSLKRLVRVIYAVFHIPKK
jgi:hypothetical protein